MRRRRGTAASIPGHASSRKWPNGAMSPAMFCGVRCTPLHGSRPEPASWSSRAVLITHHTRPSPRPAPHLPLSPALSPAWRAHLRVMPSPPCRLWTTPFPQCLPRTTNPDALKPQLAPRGANHPSARDIHPRGTRARHQRDDVGRSRQARPAKSKITEPINARHPTHSSSLPVIPRKGNPLSSRTLKKRRQWGPHAPSALWLRAKMQPICAKPRSREKKAYSPCAGMTECRLGRFFVPHVTRSLCPQIPRRSSSHCGHRLGILL